MKLELIFKILITILNEERTTAKMLSKKYDVSVKTIYRYLDILDNAGVPIVSKSGVRGGYSILEGYKLNASYFNAEEYGDLAECIRTGVIPERSKAALIDKLKVMHVSRESVFDVVYFDPQASFNAKIETIKQSIRALKCITISYQSRDLSLTERLVEPHCILFRQNVWYLYAYCRMRLSFRTFRLSRINGLRIADEGFTKKEFNVDTDYALEPHRDRGRFAELVFLCGRANVGEISEWTGNAAITPAGDKYLVKTNQPDDKYLIKDLLSYGDDIKIIAPERIKEELCRASAAILKTYSQKPRV